MTLDNSLDVCVLDRKGVKNWNFKSQMLEADSHTNLDFVVPLLTQQFVKLTSYVVVVGSFE